MVREHLALAPRKVELAARDGTTTVLEPESETVFWTTPVLYLWTGTERRPVTSEDLRTIARLSRPSRRRPGRHGRGDGRRAAAPPRLRGPAGDRRGHAQARPRPLLLAAGHGRARPDEARLPGAVVQHRLHRARAAALDEPRPRGLRAERRPRHPGDRQRRAHGRGERPRDAGRGLRRRQRGDPGRDRGEPAPRARPPRRLQPRPRPRPRHAPRHRRHRRPRERALRPGLGRPRPLLRPAVLLVGLDRVRLRGRAGRPRDDVRPRHPRAGGREPRLGPRAARVGDDALARPARDRRRDGGLRAPPPPGVRRGRRVARPRRGARGRHRGLVPRDRPHASPTTAASSSRPGS